MCAASDRPARPSTGSDRHGGQGGWERWSGRAEAAAGRLEHAAVSGDGPTGGGGEMRLTAAHDAVEGGGEPSCTCHGMGQGRTTVTL